MSNTGWDILQDDINNTGGGQTDYLSIEEGGEAIIRVLSAPYKIWKHWVQEHKRSWNCPGVGCPICEINKEHKKDTGTNKYSNQQRYLIWVLDRADNKVKLFEGSKTLFGELLSYRQEMGPLEGFDIKLKRRGSGKDTTYTIFPQPAVELSAKEIEEIGELEDIGERTKPPTPEQLTRLLDGESPDEVFASTEESDDEGDFEVDFSKGE